MLYPLVFGLPGSAVVTCAQQNFEDVLCLKNGSLIHGIVAEQRRELKYGMVTMCVGTGQGAAGIYEFLN